MSQDAARMWAARQERRERQGHIEPGNVVHSTHSEEPGLYPPDRPSLDYSYEEADSGQMVARIAAVPVSVKFGQVTIARALFWTYAFLVGFAVVGSVIATAVGIDAGPVASMTSFLLLLSGAAAVAVEIDDWYSVGALLLISGVAEVAGVITGIPFGRYIYSTNWAPVVGIGHGVVFPLMVPFAWLVIVGGCLLAARSVGRGWRSAVAAAALAALIDVPMERAMVSVFGYWYWTPPGPVFGAPNSNALGWFVVALLAVLPGACRLRPPSRPVYGAWTPALFCAFVASVGFLKGFDWAWVVLGVLALCLGVAASRTSRRSTS